MLCSHNVLAPFLIQSHWRMPRKPSITPITSITTPLPTIMEATTKAAAAAATLPVTARGQQTSPPSWTCQLSKGWRRRSTAPLNCTVKCSISAGLYLLLFHLTLWVSKPLSYLNYFSSYLIFVQHEIFFGSRRSTRWFELPFHFNLQPHPPKKRVCTTYYYFIYIFFHVLKTVTH